MASSDEDVGLSPQARGLAVCARIGPAQGPLIESRLTAGQLEEPVKTSWVTKRLADCSWDELAEALLAQAEGDRAS